jgi:CheY-like chemotaxis protein
MKLRPAPAVILFTAYANIATAVEAMRRGAFDFIPKPFTPDQIRSVLAKVAKAHALELRVQALESDLASGAPPVELESAEPSMLRALQVAFKAAETQANILILGASGTGKSVLAREIHKRSARRDSAFVDRQLPEPVAGAPRERALRPRQGLVHRRRRRDGRQGRRGRRGDALPGRDRRASPRDPAQAPKAPPGARIRARGGGPPEAGGRAGHRGLQPRSRRRGQGRPLPRGPLLPAERDRGDPSRAARAAGRPEAPGRRGPAVFRHARGQGPCRVLKGGVRRLREPTRGRATCASCAT